MLYFQSDYSQGAHPQVMEALIQSNLEHTEGYGLDDHCRRASEMIQELTGDPNCHVHMMVGGTPCNVTLIAASLKPYESIISARTGHSYFHETGAVEATGHRIIAMEGIDGKLTPDLLDLAWKEYEDEHTPLPRLVSISQPTEIGTIYSKAEMTALSQKCRQKNLLLYVDGARLGCALTCQANDLTLQELAQLCDAFYIGGTKNGALFGEALVIRNAAINDHFRWMIKRQCGLLAKGRLIGVQFEALLEGGTESLYFKIASHANEMASILRGSLTELGIPFYSDSPTNQIFPILPVPLVKQLRRDVSFHEWAPEKDSRIPIRLVTAWGTQPSDIQALLTAIRKLL